MLRNISYKCTEVLIRNKVVNENCRSIYQYGFELLYSTLFCVLSMLFIGIILRQFLLTVTFLLFFMPIRIVAGGYHATSYKRCFYLTNSIAITIVLCARVLVLWNNIFIDIILVIMGAISFMYIWKTAPINLGKYQVSNERKQYNRNCAHRLLIVELIVTIFLMNAGQNEIFFLSLLTTCVVAYMMKIERSK